MNWYKQATEVLEYQGHHQPATMGSGAPLYNLSDTYPDDIYSSNGSRYYGDRSGFDNESISIIHAARNRPDFPVTIYRAIPYVNAEVDKKIKELSKIVSYYYKFNFFPMNNHIVYEAQDKYPVPQYDYDKQQELILQDIQQQIETLKNEKVEKPQINTGDWVTISRGYAKEHGQSNIFGPYKILQKTVKAKDLFTDGDSIHEWGYDPQ